MIKRLSHLTKYWWILIIFVGALLKFLPVILKGHLPIPFDILTGAYYPWLNEKWGYVVSVPVKNGNLSDVISQFYPWFKLARDQVFSGHLPLWNPTALLGYPYYANYHLAMFYPTNLLMLVLPLAWGRTTQLLLQEFLMMLFMFLYLRNKGLKPLSCFMGAFVFSSAGLMMTDFEAASASKALTWLPLLLLGIDKYSSSKKIKFLFLNTIAFAMFLLAGHFQMNVYVGLILVFLLITKRSLKTIFPIIISLVLGLLLAAPQILPTIEMVTNSVRTNDTYIQQVNNGVLPYKHLITTFFAPDVFGNPSTNNYNGFWNYRESVGYLGIIVSLLCLISFTNRRNNFFKLGLIVCLLFVFFPPLAQLPYKLNIPLIKTSGASRLLYLVSFFASGLVAASLDDLIYKHGPKNKKIILGFFSLFMFSLAYFVPTYLGFRTSPYQSFATDLYQQALTNVRNLLIPTVLLFLGSVIIWGITKLKNQQVKTLLGYLLLALITFDLLRFHYKFNSFTPPRLDFPKTSSIDFLENHPGRFITTTTEILPSQSWSYYHLNSIFGYDPLYPYANGLYLEALNSGRIQGVSPSRYFVQVNDPNASYLDNLSVKYLLTLKRNKQGLLDNAGDIDYKINKQKFKPIFQDGYVAVLENTTAHPYAYLGYNPTEVNDQSMLETLVSQKPDYPQLFSAKLSSSYQDNPHVPVTPLSINLDLNGEFKESIESSESAVLVINQAYYPGWNAYVDGKNVPVLKANYILSGIEIPAGKHEVQFVFQPLSLILGVLCAVFAGASWLTVFLWFKLKLRKI